MEAKLSRRKCIACGKMNVVTVIYSTIMGYFVGTECFRCKNVQRYSNYLSSAESAILILKNSAWKNRRTHEH